MTQKHLFSGLGLIAIFLLLSSSSMHYWDEYFYLYSVSIHEPAKLLTIESGLAGIFPHGFFAAKVGFIYFLDWIVDLVNATFLSADTLFAVQFVFSLITVSFALASYFLLSHLVSRDDAYAISAIVLFTPLVMYFNGKVLTEVPSFLLVVISAACFLKSFHVGNGEDIKWKWVWIGIAMAFLFAAIWFRFISVIFFAGMVLGLFAMQDQRFPFWQVFIRAAITGFGAVILLVLSWLLILDDPAGSILGLLGNLVTRSQSIVIRLYAVAVFIQFFGLYLLFALWRPTTKLHRLAWVWLLFTTVPFLIGSSYAEPRFFYMALISFAILIWLGMKQLGQLWPTVFSGFKGWLIFGLFVLLNRFILIPIMPVEHDQTSYRELMDKSIAEVDAQYFVAWLSDYTLLRIMYPEKAIYLTEDWAINGDPDFFQSDDFLEWVGENGYVANKTELSQLPQPQRFVGWDYNPVIIRMESYASMVGLSVGGIKEGQKKHLELSWLWRDPQYQKLKLDSNGNYDLFELRLRTKD